MYERPRQNELHLIFTRLRAAHELLDALWASLSAHERERANRFRFERDRNSFIAARGLLRIILATCMGVESARVRFRYGSYGKPMAADREGIRFNVSHSEDIVAYALGDQQEVGVDIEHIRPLADMEQVARHFFCEAEYRKLLAAPEDLQQRAFFNCWTRKEAFIKAVGQGLSYPLDQFQVTFLPGEEPSFVQIAGNAGYEMEWSLFDAAPAENYAGALAVQNLTSQVRIWKFESSEECALFFS